MSKYEGNDHYLDPETGVLKNKLNIRAEEELKEAEASLVAWRSFQLAGNPIKGCFDLDHLKAIHKHLFCDVYEWAGELRNIDLSKENSYFANYTHIVSASRPVFEKLVEEDYLKGLDAAAFSTRAAWRDQCSASFPRRERQSTAGIHQSPGFPKWLLHRMEEHKPRADDSGLNRILPSGRQHKVCRFYKGQSERASGFRFNQNSPTQEKKKSVRAGLSFIASLDLMSTFRCSNKSNEYLSIT